MKGIKRDKSGSRNYWKKHENLIRHDKNIKNRVQSAHQITHLAPSTSLQRVRNNNNQVFSDLCFIWISK